PQHDAVALDVDAPASGPAGQLGVLPRRDVGVGLAVPLRQTFEYDRARGHVDTERESLRRAHRLDEAPAEQVLNAFLERRQQPRVVAGDTACEPLDEVVVAEHVEVLTRDVCAALVDVRANIGLLGRGRQSQTAGQALPYGGRATGAAEDEHDRG